MDIRAWLRGLGLERYEQAFRENAIDEARSPETRDALRMMMRIQTTNLRSSAAQLGRLRRKAPFSFRRPLNSNLIIQAFGVQSASSTAQGTK